MDVTRPAASSSTKLILLASVWTIICLLGSILWLCIAANERARRNSRTGSQRAASISTSLFTQRSSENILAKDVKKVVTIAADNIVYSVDSDTGKVKLIDETAEELKKLAPSINVILIAKVASDEQAESIMKLLEDAGLIGDSLIKKHRVLFCESFVGRSSIVRQISPTLHFESSVETVVSLENRNVTFAFVNFVCPVADAKDSVLPVGVVLPPEKSTLYQSACGSFKDCVALYEGLVHR